MVTNLEHKIKAICRFKSQATLNLTNHHVIPIEIYMFFGNYALNINQVTYCHIENAYQFILLY